MIKIKELTAITAVDFKNLLIDNLRSEDINLNISKLARAVGVDPSTMNRYINSAESHLPTYLIPHFPDDLRTTVLHWLDNNSGNPIKGYIDTSDLDGSVRDECDGIIEALGNVIKLERTMPGNRSVNQKIALFQRIGEMAQRAELEIGNRKNKILNLKKDRYYESNA